MAYILIVNKLNNIINFGYSIYGTTWRPLVLTIN